MDKQNFVKLVNAIEVQITFDRRHADKLSELFNSNVESYNNHNLIDTVLEFLKLEFKDNHKDSWIDYFCWEINFGKNCNKCATRKDGSEIDLSTSEALFDFLIEKF